MMNGIALAEDNLIRCGVPFVPDYQFHGKYADYRAAENKKIRESMDLDNQEEADWKRVEERKSNNG